MDLQLSGKRALVTGSSSGVGAAIARQLAAEGVEVVVHGRDPERTQSVASEITANGGTAHFMTGDLTQEAAARSLCERIEDSLGGIDILVNNAGGRPGGWERNGWLGQGARRWLETYELNVLATARMIDAFTPGMIRRGWGRVIQIASAVAIHQPAHFPDYQAAKAAEINLSRSLSRSLAGTGVTSNSLSLGIIYTPGSEKELASVAGQAGLGEDWRRSQRKLALEVFRQSVPRIGRGEDIAALVAFLASACAEFITGTNILIDGGM